MSPAPKQRFRSPHGWDAPTTELRQEFLRAVDRVAPELASVMVKSVGPASQRWADHTTEGQAHEDFLTAWQEWSEPFGLHRDPWILNHACCLLTAFLNNPDSTPSFAGVPLLSAHLRPAPGSKITPPGPYYPDTETRAEYETRIKEYADLVEDAARDTKWEPGRWKPDAPTHLEWLARFQVQGETACSIAEHPDTGNPRAPEKDIRTVEKALREMAELIGLTRRTVS